MLKAFVKKTFNAIGYDIVQKKWGEIPEYKQKGFDEEFSSLYEFTKDYTMTSPERMFALYRAVRYLNANRVKGSMVECGVAAGGSMMMAALTAKAWGNTQRDMWLYDTYEGMPEPTSNDVNYRGDRAHVQWAASEKDDHNEWCYASLESVRANMARTNYPTEKIRFVKGRVEKTIPRGNTRADSTTKVRHRLVCIDQTRA